MRSSHLTVFLVGVLSAASGVMAEPQTDKVKKAVSVVETVTVTSSKPMYDGSYFASKVTFEDACNMTKTVTYFDKNGDIEKVSNTAFDVSKIDPAKVALDPWGGAKFWSYNEQPVFHMQHSQGSDFSAEIPGDNFSVADMNTQATPLVKALKTLAKACADT